jgi:hypothetical protein
VYETEQRYLNLPVVPPSKFGEIWNAVFPNLKIRAWINPPGKCNLCGNIDSKRRVATESGVKEALRQCHLIHRGGFINPERIR